MGRKLKKGFDYFTLDTSFSDSVRLSALEIGGHGLSLLIELWQIIYGKHGYYMDFSDDFKILFLHSSVTKIDLTELDRCLNVFFKRGVFSKDIYDKYKVLTSDSIQERYIETCIISKRVNSCIYEEYLLINKKDFETKNFEFKNLFGINTEEIQIYSEEIGINTEESTQTKEKESKVNKTKQKITQNEQDAFEQARKFYLGSKKGLQTELDNFVKKYPDEWQTILPLLLPAILREKVDKEQKLKNSGFNQQWKNFSTWINGRCWEIEYPNVTEKEVKELGISVTTNESGEQKVEVKQDRTSFPLYSSMQVMPHVYPEGTESRCGYYVIKKGQCVRTNKY